MSLRRFHADPLYGIWPLLGLPCGRPSKAELDHFISFSSVLVGHNQHFSFQLRGDDYDSPQFSHARRTSIWGQSIFVDRKRVVTVDGIRATLGIEFPPTGGNANRVQLLKLYIQHWQHSDVLTHLEIRQRARYFLMYMLGQSLAANRGSVVQLWWLLYFWDFLTIEGMNWVSLSLVTLYHSINMCFSLAAWEPCWHVLSVGGIRFSSSSFLLCHL